MKQFQHYNHKPFLFYSDHYKIRMVCDYSVETVDHYKIRMVCDYSVETVSLCSRYIYIYNYIYIVFVCACRSSLVLNK